MTNVVFAVDNAKTQERLPERSSGQVAIEHATAPVLFITVDP